MPPDREAFARYVDARVDEIAASRSQPGRLLQMLVEAAPVLRIAGRIDEARRTAAAAIALAELLEDVRAAFAGQLELAQVMQWEARFDISTPLFDRLVSQARSVSVFQPQLHDVLHAMGVNLFDQGRFGEAARFFREAQALRRAHGLEHLLEASAEALRRTLARGAERDAYKGSTSDGSGRRTNS